MQIGFACSITMCRFSVNYTVPFFFLIKCVPKTLTTHNKNGHMSVSFSFVKSAKDQKTMQVCQIFMINHTQWPKTFSLFIFSLHNSYMQVVFYLLLGDDSTYQCFIYFFKNMCACVHLLVFMEPSLRSSGRGQKPRKSNVHGLST